MQDWYGCIVRILTGTGFPSPPNRTPSCPKQSVHSPNHQSGRKKNVRVGVPGPGCRRPTFPGGPSGCGSLGYLFASRLAKGDDEESQRALVAISPAGDRLLTGGHFAPLTVWDLSTGTSIWTDPHTEYTGFSDLAWSPDGCRILAGLTNESAVTMRDAATGALIRTCATLGHCSYLAWAPDDSAWAAWSSHSPPGLRVWDADGEAVCWEAAWVTELGADGALAWSPDGRHPVLGDRGGILHFFDALTGTPGSHRPVSDTPSRIWHVSWSPGDDRMGVLSAGSALTVLDGTAERPARRIEVGERAGCTACWSPDRRHIAVGLSGAAAGVALYAVGTGREVHRFSIPSGSWRESTADLAWAPNGAFLVSGHRDGIVRGWDARFLYADPPFAPSREATTGPSRFPEPA